MRRLIFLSSLAFVLTGASVASAFWHDYPCPIPAPIKRADIAKDVALNLISQILQQIAWKDTHTDPEPNLTPAPAPLSGDLTSPDAPMLKYAGIAMADADRDAKVQEKISEKMRSSTSGTQSVVGASGTEILNAALSGLMERVPELASLPIGVHAEPYEELAKFAIEKTLPNTKERLAVPVEYRDAVTGDSIRRIAMLVGPVTGDAWKRKLEKLKAIMTREVELGNGEVDVECGICGGKKPVQPGDSVNKKKAKEGNAWQVIAKKFMIVSEMKSRRLAATVLHKDLMRRRVLLFEILSAQSTARTVNERDKASAIWDALLREAGNIVIR